MVEHPDQISEVIDEPIQVAPLLPLRDVVVYPHMVIPLFVGREKSIRALENAMESNKQILLAAQTDASTDEPSLDDIHRVATLANILQLLKLPDGTVKVLVEGSQRARVVNFLGSDDFFQAQFTILAPEQMDE
ncbi:MAG TPA: endopeptidase La, partial [Gammaproteobacteria bacterium]|nr:endopeptidase La [Gammaproteobacteria bacterium]